jgi:hypothetical protein
MMPIRIDIEADGCKLREAFLWRPDDPLLTPARLAHLLCDDFGVDRAVFTPLLTQSITEQWQDYQAFVDAKRGVSFRLVKARIPLDVIVGGVQFVDEGGVVVDVGEEVGVLLKVGEGMCKDYELPAEFGPAISFSLIEQQYQIQRALIATGFTVSGAGVSLNGTADVELTQRLMSVIGPQQPVVARAVPMVLSLTPADLDRLEQIREREGRRKRRQTRSRRDAWALSTPPKLHRSSLSSGSRKQSLPPPALSATTTMVPPPTLLLPDQEESEQSDTDNDEVYVQGRTLMMHQTGSVGTRTVARGRGRRRGRGRGRRQQ